MCFFSLCGAAGTGLMVWHAHWESQAGADDVIPLVCVLWCCIDLCELLLCCCVVEFLLLLLLLLLLLFVCLTVHQKAQVRVRKHSGASSFFHIFH